MASCSPADLVASAKCLNCIPDGRLGALKTYLMLRWIGCGAVTVSCNPEAAAYLSAAGISDQTQADAICQLVLDLKTTGAPTFWEREDVIYPLLGTTFASQSVNLKQPGTHNFTVPGPAPNYLATGLQGTAAGYVDTQYSLTGRLNSVRAMVYTQQVEGGALPGALCGCGISPDFLLLSNVGNQLYKVNDATLTVTGRACDVGLCVVQRKDAANKQFADRTSGAFITDAIASTGVPANTLTLLAYSSFAPTFFSTAIISGFSIGSPFASDAELLAYKAIWDKFETAVGRGHP